MSLQDKVGWWTSGSRFSIMVDIDPSGHIQEHEILKQRRTILALIRRRESRSTFMFGEESLVDINYIRVFEFDETPLEVVQDAVTWAEDFAAARVAAYREAFPWKQPQGD
jgi:hypothetical protein